MIDVREESGKSTITCEGEHHARIRRQGKEPAMPHTHDDEHHESDGAALTENVDEDLCDWLTYVRVYCFGEVLDGKEEGDEEEEAEDGGAADGH